MKWPGTWLASILDNPWLSGSLCPLASSQRAWGWGYLSTGWSLLYWISEVVQITEVPIPSLWYLAYKWYLLWSWPAVFRKVHWSVSFGQDKSIALSSSSLNLSPFPQIIDHQPRLLCIRSNVFADLQQVQIIEVLDNWGCTATYMYLFK